ncbi:MAG: putative DNA binding domain-containing protein, partial [Chloroflexi bacterium]|nr:putative DNA binding domain-containing protein [Chloroflexota bacterium]
AEALSELLVGSENDRLLFLSAKASPAAIAEGLAALANAHGGMAVVGVTKGGKPQAGNDSGEMQERAIQAGLLTDPPLILPTPQSVEVDGNPLVVVHVPPGLPHIYSLQGRYLTRTAGQNRTLTTPELRRLLFDRADAGFETGVVEGATLDDLDRGQIRRYLETIQVGPQEDVGQLLVGRGCVVKTGDGADYAPTAAGILLFGRNPQRFLRSAEIVCVRYPGPQMSDEFVRQEIGGPLGDQIRQAEAFVVGNMRRGMRIAGIIREEVNEYPVAVVREAIVNAVAHRDYSIRGEGIRLLMFSDRLEVYSPGRLPGHVTLENLLEERYSRNEALVAVLSDLGYIERLGYGIDRMIGAMRSLGLSPPEFAETAAGFQVTLRSAGESPASPQPQQPGEHAFLNERQEMALAFLHQNGRITNSDYQQLAPDVSAETIRRDLSDLVERNLLIRIGSKRATYYILK